MGPSAPVPGAEGRGESVVAAVLCANKECLIFFFFLFFLFRIILSLWGFPLLGLVIHGVTAPLQPVLRFLQFLLRRTKKETKTQSGESAVATRKTAPTSERTKEYNCQVRLSNVACELLERHSHCVAKRYAFFGRDALKVLSAAVRALFCQSWWW